MLTLEFSLKSLHTLLFDKYLDNLLVKFEQSKLYGPYYTKFWAFWQKKKKKKKKKGVLKTIFDTALTPFWKTFLELKQLFDTFDFQTTIFQCSDTRNQVKGYILFSSNLEVSFLSVLTLSPVSAIYHLKAYVVNLQNSNIMLIWLPWKRY